MTADKAQKLCHVYLHRQKDEAIIASMAMSNIWVEDPEDTSKANVSPKRDFGKLVQERYEKSGRKVDWDLRDMKKTDWPAFKVSGERSAAEFERRWIRVSVRSSGNNSRFVRMDTEVARRNVFLAARQKIDDPTAVANDLLTLRMTFLKAEMA